MDDESLRIVALQAASRITQVPMRPDCFTTTMVGGQAGTVDQQYWACVKWRPASAPDIVAIAKLYQAFLAGEPEEEKT